MQFNLKQSTTVKKVAAANGKITKAAKPKKLSEPAKKSVSNSITLSKLNGFSINFVLFVQAKAAAATETPTKKAQTPKKKVGVDAYIMFEVCKSCHTYKRNANQIYNDICAKFPKKTFDLVINDHGLSRRGSFEITVSKKKGGSASAALIWSGISKGPPRKLKFPESSALFDSVKTALA